MNREQQRAELHRTIWNAANQLVHGGVLTPMQFMNYMLGGLFYRFISENISDCLIDYIDCVIQLPANLFFGTSIVDYERR